MTYVNQTSNRTFAEGAALADGEVFARLFRLFVEKGIVSRDDVDQLLTDAGARFLHPLATDIESAAVGRIMRIRDRLSA